MDNGYGLDDNTVKMIASTVYGENRGQGDKAVLHTASSVFNRIGKNEWANSSIPEILYNGFYSVRDANNGKNNGYAEAMTGKFPDKDSENDFKNIYSKVALMNRGNLKPTKTQFYFTGKEIKDLIKNNSFDFSKVDEGDSFGKSRTFYYK